MPFSTASFSESPWAAAYWRTSSEIFMEQKCGPHIEQKWASFCAVGGQGFVVVLAGGDWVEAEIELVFPTELKTGF